MNTKFNILMCAEDEYFYQDKINRHKINVMVSIYLEKVFIDRDNSEDFKCLRCGTEPDIINADGISLGVIDKIKFIVLFLKY